MSETVVGVVSGVYKTISYKLRRGGNRLVIILPRAGAGFMSHKRLVEALGVYGSVLFVESGYFGLSRVDDKLNLWVMGDFARKIKELVEELGYKELLLMGESAGAIHALNYSRLYGDTVKLILLSNPALYKPQLTHKLFYIPLLNLAINSSPDIFLKGLEGMLSVMPKGELKQLGKAFKQLRQKVGSESYLRCLKEIVDFYPVYETSEVRSNQNKTLVVSGGADKFFELLCNKGYCKESKAHIEIQAAGHGLIDNFPEKVIEVMRPEMGES